MNFETVNLFVFSPTHTSLKIARSVAAGTGITRTFLCDLTLPPVSDGMQVRNTLAVIAVPVYGGRVAETAVERLRTVRAEHVPAVLTVVYGNRDYEDALLELRDLAVERGFTPLAAGAFVGEHSYSRPDRPVAAGRPDEADLAAAFGFGKTAAERLARYGTCSDIGPLAVKGNFPYKVKGAGTPATPETLDGVCTACGYCAEICPVGCIEVRDKAESDAAVCIKCCACVKECPAGARVFDTPYTDLLYKNCRTPRPPELFF